MADRDEIGHEAFLDCDTLYISLTGPSHDCRILQMPFAHLPPLAGNRIIGNHQVKVRRYEFEK